MIPYLDSYEDISTVLYSGLSETPSSKLSSLLYLYPSYYPAKEPRLVPLSSTWCDSWVNIGDGVDVNSSDYYSRYYVIIYGDGKTVAFFAPSNDVNRIDSVHVTVYTIEDKTEEPSSVPSSIPSVIPYLASY